MFSFFRVLAFGTVTLAQFVTPPDDLIETIGNAGVTIRYKEVPTGICELDPNVKSFSGYADVENDQHIFWWFFEARNGSPQDSPVTIWINGGPGSSSMTGLFAELGPCSVDYYGNVHNNPFSWTNDSNMLFIDQPSQVGFSYSQPVPAYEENGMLVVLPDDVCPYDAEGLKLCGTYSNPNSTATPNSTSNAAPAFWETLQGFMGAFPQYSRHGFNIATESYGGHYGPVFGAYIEQQNDLDIPGTQKVHLRTLLVGNGWFEPIIQFQAFYNYTVSPGNTYDHFPFDASTELLLYNNLYSLGKCVDQLRDCKLSGANSVCRNADNYCMSNVEDLYQEFFGRDVYDIREPDPNPFPYKFFVEYLNLPEVQKAVGAYTNFSSFSHTVNQAFSTTGDDAREVDTIADIRFLLMRNITVALYAGDADYDCNWIGGEAVAEAVEAPGFSWAGYTDLQTNDRVIHGQVKQAGRFSFTRIYESGHMVPFYQPVAALELFERAVHQFDIASGSQIADTSYITKGPKRSTYREGNATMQWDIVASNVTYNTTTNRPGETWLSHSMHTEKLVGPNYASQFHFQTMGPGSNSSIWRLILQYFIYLFSS